MFAKIVEKGDFEKKLQAKSAIFLTKTPFSLRKN